MNFLEFNFKKMELKKATKNDVHELLEIEKGVMGTKTYSGYSSLEEIEEWVKQEEVFLIMVDEAVAGSVSYELKDDSAYISGLVVKPEFQKRGIARKALAEILEKLKKYEKIGLAVHPENPAIKLYESFGFSVIGRKENFYGDGEPRLIMEKKS